MTDLKRLENSDSEMMRRIIQTRHGAKVERCHGIAHIGSYSNATHQWGVAHLAYVFWPSEPRIRDAALFHDIPEGWVGDIPAPVMRNLPRVRSEVGEMETEISHDLGLPSEHDLTQDEFAKLKACDRLEFLLWCHDQLRLGNVNVTAGIAAVTEFLVANPPPAPADAFLARVVAGEFSMAREAGYVREIATRIGATR